MLCIKYIDKSWSQENSCRDTCIKHQFLFPVPGMELVGNKISIGSMLIVCYEGWVAGLLITWTWCNGNHDYTWHCHNSHTVPTRPACWQLIKHQAKERVDGKKSWMFWSWSTSDQSYHCNVLSTQFPTIWENSYWSWHLLRRFSSDHPLCSGFQTSLVSCWGAGAQLGENSLVFIASYSIVCLGYISPWQGGRRLPAFVHVNLRKLLASTWFWWNSISIKSKSYLPSPPWCNIH